MCVCVSNLCIERASFVWRTRPAHLELERVRQDDEAEYRCRVDFKKGRTVNTLIALRVVQPPEELRIVTPESPHTPLKGLIGPYNEGQQLTLVCLALGGSPRPQISWRRDFQLIDNENSSGNGNENETHQRLDKDGTASNELRIGALTRNHLLSQFTCQAHNSNLSAPLQASITLDVNLKPQDISLKQLVPAAHEPLIVGRQATFECASQGSRPQASLHWSFAGARHDTPMTGEFLHNNNNSAQHSKQAN